MTLVCTRLCQQNRPRASRWWASNGSEMVWDLLVAKKRGEEQEKLFVELQVAYDKIRSHERQLQTSKEALERANEKLESRLAEIFFTHEFFKALTSFTSVDDVTLTDRRRRQRYPRRGDQLRLPVRARGLDAAICVRARGAPRMRSSRLSRSGTRFSGTRVSGWAVQETDVAYGSDSCGVVRAAEEIRSQAAIPLRTGDTSSA